MPNAAATVLPWKRLPSVSEQIDQVPHFQVAGAEGRQQHRAGVHGDRAAVAGAGNAPAPRAAACRGAAESPMRPAYSLKITIRLFFDLCMGASFPSSQWPFRTGRADRAQPRRARAGEPGRTPVEREADCRHPDIGGRAANPRSGQGLVNDYRRSGSQR